MMMMMMLVMMMMMIIVINIIMITDDLCQKTHVYAFCNIYVHYATTYAVIDVV